jgi:hypothetical protein
MNISKHITNQLYQLFKDERDVAGTLERNDRGVYDWRLSFEGQDIFMQLSNPDRHSAELHMLQRVAVQPSVEDASAVLHAQADELIHRLGYLEEPLGVWEFEERDCTAQMRSLPPQRDGEEVFYWEVLLQVATIASGLETTTRISRYHWQPGMMERETMAYPATFSLLGRLCESLHFDAEQE